MIVVKIIGGLGNQLFQLSFGKAIEKKLGVDVYYDISDFDNYDLRKFELHHFNGEIKVAQKEDLKKVKNLKNKLKFKIYKFLGIHRFKIKDLCYYQEYIDNYHSGLFELGKNIYFDGYWQSEKYFNDYSEFIKNQLIVKTEASTENQNLLKNIINECSVSVHIRRGDYVANENVFQLYGTCSLEYYEKSFDFISSKIDNPVFYVFSDDIEWAKQNLINGYSKIFVDINDADKGYEDLRLMSSCKHNIIANSSFSWWGAWLNSNPSKIIIAPRLWFADTKIDTRDIIPELWVRI